MCGICLKTQCLQLSHCVTYGEENFLPASSLALKLLETVLPRIQESLLERLHFLSEKHLIHRARLLCRKLSGRTEHCGQGPLSAAEIFGSLL